MGTLSSPIYLIIHSFIYVSICMQLYMCYNYLYSFDFTFAKNSKYCICEKVSCWKPLEKGMEGSLWRGEWCPLNSPGKNTAVCCHSLLQGIIPTQELNLGLPHCRQILYCLSHQESPGKPGGLQFIGSQRVRHD